jgi:hypothetical protein
MPLTVEQLSISLDEEREKIVAIQRKHSNNIKDLQRQVQLYSKYDIILIIVVQYYI